MQLTLQSISMKVAAQTWLYDINLSPKAGAVTVLLGATQAGKTSLMRIMAGLDAPTSGRVMVDDVDVTGQSVRKRSVAMVYQQFINYPSMTVAQNIGSPLKLRGEKNIDEQVTAIAKKLHIDMFLDRLPAELSGGQQQRVALARALAKNAPLILLDEPLVNLDYKLREELREELTQVFSASDATVVYATTEPSEALLLGGYTAVLDEGRLLQYGPADQVFNRPKSLQVAKAFSDPPINLLAGVRVAQGVRLAQGTVVPLSLPDVMGAGEVTLGIRAGALRMRSQDGDLALSGKVLLAEISGSDTYVHLDTVVGNVVAQLTGVHYFEIGSPLSLYFSPALVFVFDAGGDLLFAPDKSRSDAHGPN
jgi:glycerol transport system ATP-binding protein